MFPFYRTLLLMILFFQAYIRFVELKDVPTSILSNSTDQMQSEIKGSDNKKSVNVDMENNVLLEDRSLNESPITTESERPNLNESYSGKFCFKFRLEIIIIVKIHFFDLKFC